MGQGVVRWRGDPGGIASLADLVATHGLALDYDLMTLARRTIDDVGGTLSWRALLHFVGGLPPTSRLARELDPRLESLAPWLDGSMVAPLVADLIDCTNLARWEYATSCVGRGQRRPRGPRAVPRPWREDGGGKRTIGRDPIPTRDFEGWWDSMGARD